MSIVIIDDSATNLVVLKRMAKGCFSGSVETFSSVFDGHAFLSAHAAELIIVDCEMPEMNGIELIAEIRCLPQHTNTTILMVTQHRAEKIQAQALDAGATEFLSKPVDALQFKARVRTLLPKQVAAA